MNLKIIVECYIINLQISTKNVFMFKDFFFFLLLFFNRLKLRKLQTKII